MKKDFISKCLEKYGKDLRVKSEDYKNPIKRNDGITEVPIYLSENELELLLELYYKYRMKIVKEQFSDCDWYLTLDMYKNLQNKLEHAAFDLSQQGYIYSEDWWRKMIKEGVFKKFNRKRKVRK